MSNGAKNKFKQEKYFAHQNICNVIVIKTGSYYYKTRQLYQNITESSRTI